jgi:hypothetical protein
MVDKNNRDPSSHTSHLFMLRMWPEDLGGGQTDWRGKVQHVNSGEVRYFRDWPTLEAFVEGLLLKTDPEGGDAGRARRGDRETRGERDAGRAGRGDRETRGEGDT